MKNTNTYNAEAELDRGAYLTAVSYDKTQRAMVLDGRATLGGKAVTAEISGVATGRSEDGTVNLWLSGFSFKGSDGNINQVPCLNAVAVLAPRQGALDTAKTIAAHVNYSKTPYKARTSGDRKKATISIVFTGKKPS
ncbi:MAG TPA: hypothetical protein PKI19_10785 [Elusimicrobiales bacterium]|nr:hypothetical protein [Elusimicrobiales bacterium]